MSSRSKTRQNKKRVAKSLIPDLTPPSSPNLWGGERSIKGTIGKKLIGGKDEMKIWLGSLAALWESHSCECKGQLQRESNERAVGSLMSKEKNSRKYLVEREG